MKSIKISIILYARVLGYVHVFMSVKIPHTQLNISFKFIQIPLYIFYPGLVLGYFKEGHVTPPQKKKKHYNLDQVRNSVYKHRQIDKTVIE